MPTHALKSAVDALGTRSLSGTGSPEGVITASPGAIYQQTDGGDWATDGNSAAWIKDLGTGNTGWKKLRTTIPIFLDLFGPRGGDGKSLSTGQAAYGFATAVTASTKLLKSYLSARVVDAVAQVIWTPNDADNGIEVLSMDGVTAGVPDNPDQMAEFTGLTTATPIVSALNVKTDTVTIFNGTADRYVGWRFKSDVAVAPVLYHVVVRIDIEV